MKTQYIPKTLGAKLGWLVEECGEVLAAVGKTLRHGVDSCNPELPRGSAELNGNWILRELDDLKFAADLATIAIREELGLDEPIPPPDWRKLLEDVVESLPKCDDGCGRPATRAYRRGEGRWCDHCSGLRSPTPPEYPRAKAVRAAMAALERHK
jgi:hypothetical protein